MVGQPGSQPGPGLDDDLMPGPNQFLDAHR